LFCHCGVSWCTVECSGLIDLVFVLDSAGTVHAERWRYMLDFVEWIVERLDVASDRTRVAVVYWSDSAYVGFTLDRYFVRQVRALCCNAAATIRSSQSHRHRNKFRCFTLTIQFT